jgi:methionine-rich copper-binding protein CopC
MMKYLIALFILSLAIFLVSCGGTTTKPQPNPADKIAPTLVSSLPAEGASAVPINVKLGFAFSEAMDESSLELTSNPAIILGTATWNESSTSVAFDNGNLSASITFTLTLKAKDVSGNALAPTMLTFTTSDSADTAAPSTPTGLVATPANGQVTLTWQDNPENDVAGYTVFVGTAQDKLESKDFVSTNSKTITGLTNGTQYFFALDAVDAANNHSGQTTPVSATPSTTVTDTTPPTLQSSDPADGSTIVKRRNPPITLVFSEPMDTTSFSLTFTPPNPVENIVLGPAAITPFEVQWSEADTVATLTLEPPDNVLIAETTFTLTFSAKDKAGNALSGDKEISFKTGFAVPELVSSVPADGATNIPTGSLVITLTFSEAVKPGTFQVDDQNFPFGCELLAPEIVSQLLDCRIFDDNTYTLGYKGQDLDGHDFSGSISFSTVPDTFAPRVDRTSPLVSGENIPLETRISIGFNDEMDESSTPAAVSSSPDVGCTWVLFEKTLLECIPANLQPETTYEITVSTVAKDTSGNALAAPYIFRFTTIKGFGSLQLDISGLPPGREKVQITGPNFDSGLLDKDTTFPDLFTGDYTVTALEFTLAPGTSLCLDFRPTPASQTVTVTTDQTATATVIYKGFSCAPLLFDF